MLHSLVRTGTETDNSMIPTLFLSGDIASGDLSCSIEDDKDIVSVIEDNKAMLSNGGINASYVAETEHIVWTAKSQKGHELGFDSLIPDYVRLLMTEDGRLVLRYDVAGESTFEMPVQSENEAIQIIWEDNKTTEQLYPDNPELKWIKIDII